MAAVSKAQSTPPLCIPLGRADPPSKRDAATAARLHTAADSGRGGSELDVGRCSLSRVYAAMAVLTRALVLRGPIQGRR